MIVTSIWSVAILFAIGPLLGWNGYMYEVNCHSIKMYQCLYFKDSIGSHCLERQNYFLSRMKMKNLKTRSENSLSFMYILFKGFLVSCSIDLVSKTFLDQVKGDVHIFQTGKSVKKSSPNWAIGKDV